MSSGLHLLQESLAYRSSWGRCWWRVLLRCWSSPLKSSLTNLLSLCFCYWFWAWRLRFSFLLHLSPFIFDSGWALASLWSFWLLYKAPQMWVLDYIFLRPFFYSFGLSMVWTFIAALTFWLLQSAWVCAISPALSLCNFFQWILAALVGFSSAPSVTLWVSLLLLSSRLIYKAYYVHWHSSASLLQQVFVISLESLAYLAPFWLLLVDVISLFMSWSLAGTLLGHTGMSGWELFWSIASCWGYQLLRLYFYYLSGFYWCFHWIDWNCELDGVVN